MACNHNPDGSMSMQPNSLDLTPPPGPPEYEQGWSDGCSSGSNAYSTPFYKMVGAFEFKYDPVMMKNKIYRQIWKDAYLYCAIYWEKTKQQEL